MFLNFKSFNFSNFFQNKTNLGLVLVLAALVFGLVFVANKFFFGKQTELPIEEVELPFDAEGPYALLVPRRDGDALNLNIFRVSSYDSIAYELSYQSSGSSADEGIGSIDRGVQGTIDTKGKKSEYNQEVLFGTCSQGYSTGASHCVFDKGVENGTLILRVKNKPERGAKTQKVYKMPIAWHLQKPDVALGIITSADNHFIYKSSVSKEELTVAGFTIVNDLTGVPKLPEGKKVLGRVYTLNVPSAKIFPKGIVTFELIDNPSQGAKLARYNEANNNWEVLETKIDKNKLSAEVFGAGIFAVLVDKTN